VKAGNGTGNEKGDEKRERGRSSFLHHVFLDVVRRVVYKGRAFENDGRDLRAVFFRKNKMMNGYCIWRLVLAVCLIPVGAAFESKVRSQENYTEEALQKFFLAEAQTYDLEMTKSKVRLLLREQPLLTWQNPEKILNQGLLFAWMDGTRPAALVSIFSYSYNNQVHRRHEAISLAPHALTAKLDGDVVWKPAAAPVQGVQVAEEMQPAANEARRLIQMRSIARIVTGNYFSPTGEKRELRLLTQPLIRYASEKDGVLDGGLFALSIGTDPEVLVQIEARKDSSGEKWFVTPFRSHYERLEVSYDGKPIWEVPRVPELMDTNYMQLPFATEPFFVFYPKLKLPAASLLK
jgi:hypothetical protein